MSEFTSQNFWCFFSFALWRLRIITSLAWSKFVFFIVPKPPKGHSLRKLTINRVLSEICAIDENPNKKQAPQLFVTAVNYSFPLFYFVGCRCLNIQEVLSFHKLSAPFVVDWPGNQSTIWNCLHHSYRLHHPCSSEKLGPKFKTYFQHY